MKVGGRNSASTISDQLKPHLKVRVKMPSRLATGMRIVTDVQWPHRGVGVVATKAHIAMSKNDTS